MAPIWFDVVGRIIGAQPLKEAEMKRILVTIDGSPSSTEAVAFGVELAAEHRAELMFVHVVPKLDVVPAAGFGAIGAPFPTR
jgi:nucleotide-binding universal stress UspA family protein